MQLWYHEEESDSLKFSYKIKDSLFRGVSDFQTVDVLESVAYGKMLLIDGLVMITEKDEFVYHEMIAHIPALIHGAPKKVLVIGGGDGGTVRELLKHRIIDEIVLCEIDLMVVETAKKFFPGTASSLSDERVQVKIGDGIKYLKEHPENSLDLVIVDSTDPIGPGEGLFTAEFYQSVAKALKSDGMMVCQSESPWYEHEVHKKIQKNIAAGFEFRSSYIGAVPTYPRGFWSWTIAASVPIDPKSVKEEVFLSLPHDSLQYLNYGLISASFEIPNFFRRKLML